MNFWVRIVVGTFWSSALANLKCLIFQSDQKTNIYKPYAYVYTHSVKSQLLHNPFFNFMFHAPNHQYVSL